MFEWIFFNIRFFQNYFQKHFQFLFLKKQYKKKQNCMTTTLVGSRMLWMPVSVIIDCKTANTNNLLELQQKPKNFFFSFSWEKKLMKKSSFLGHIFSIICCSHCDFSASMIKVLYWYSFEHPYNQRLSFFLFFNQRRKKIPVSRQTMIFIFALAILKPKKTR